MINIEKSFSGGDPDESLVWAVSVLGKVYVRQRVTTQCPEGKGWLHIPTPDKSEVSQISVGPTGLVWAVTWHGKALVRLGVTRIDPFGTTWSVLDPPDPNGNHLHTSYSIIYFKRFFLLKNCPYTLQTQHKLGW